MKPVSASATGPAWRRRSANDSRVDHSTIIRAGRSLRLQTSARSPVTSPTAVPNGMAGRWASLVTSAGASRGLTTVAAAAPDSIETNARRDCVTPHYTRRRAAAPG